MSQQSSGAGRNLDDEDDSSSDESFEPTNKLSKQDSVQSPYEELGERKYTEYEKPTRAANFREKFKGQAGKKFNESFFVDFGRCDLDFLNENLHDCSTHLSRSPVASPKFEIKLPKNKRENKRNNAGNLQQNRATLGNIGEHEEIDSEEGEENSEIPAGIQTKNGNNIKSNLRGNEDQIHSKKEMKDTINGNAETSAEAVELEEKNKRESAKDVKPELAPRDMQLKPEVAPREMQDKPEVSPREIQDKPEIAPREMQDKPEVAPREMQDKPEVAPRDIGKEPDKPEVVPREPEMDNDIPDLPPPDLPILPPPESEDDLTDVPEVEFEDSKDKLEMTHNEAKKESSTPGTPGATENENCEQENGHIPEIKEKITDKSELEEVENEIEEKAAAEETSFGESVSVVVNDKEKLIKSNSVSTDKTEPESIESLDENGIELGDTDTHVEEKEKKKSAKQRKLTEKLNKGQSKSKLSETGRMKLVREHRICCCNCTRKRMAILCGSFCFVIMVVAVVTSYVLMSRSGVEVITDGFSTNFTTLDIENITREAMRGTGTGTPDGLTDAPDANQGGTTKAPA